MNNQDKIALSKIKEERENALKNTSLARILWDETTPLKTWLSKVKRLDIIDCSSDFKYGVIKLTTAIDEFTGNASAVTGLDGIRNTISLWEYKSVFYRLNYKKRKQELEDIELALLELEQVANR
jgi:hypothetical protein